MTWTLYHVKLRNTVPCRCYDMNERGQNRFMEEKYTEKNTTSTSVPHPSVSVKTENALGISTLPSVFLLSLCICLQTLFLLVFSHQKNLQKGEGKQAKKKEGKKRSERKKKLARQEKDRNSEPQRKKY